MKQSNFLFAPVVGLMSIALSISASAATAPQRTAQATEFSRPLADVSPSGLVLIEDEITDVSINPMGVWRDFDGNLHLRTPGLMQLAQGDCSSCASSPRSTPRPSVPSRPSGVAAGLGVLIDMLGEYEKAQLRREEVERQEVERQRAREQAEQAGSRARPASSGNASKECQNIEHDIKELNGFRAEHCDVSERRPGVTELCNEATNTLSKLRQAQSSCGTETSAARQSGGSGFNAVSSTSQPEQQVKENERKQRESEEQSRWEEDVRQRNQGRSQASPALASVASNPFTAAEASTSDDANPFGQASNDGQTSRQRTQGRGLANSTQTGDASNPFANADASTKEAGDQFETEPLGVRDCLSVGKFNSGGISTESSTFKNQCNFKVSYTYCISNGDKNGAFDCSKQRFGSGRVVANGTDGFSIFGVAGYPQAKVEFMTCRLTAKYSLGAVNARWNSVIGITGICR